MVKEYEQGYSYDASDYDFNLPNISYAFRNNRPELDSFEIAGSYYRSDAIKDLISELRAGDYLWVRRVSVESDPYALGVYLDHNGPKHLIGYIPREVKNNCISDIQKTLDVNYKQYDSYPIYYRFVVAQRYQSGWSRGALVIQLDITHDSQVTVFVDDGAQ